MIMDKLKNDFENLLSKEDKEEFVIAKLKLYESIFTNFRDEKNLILCLALFEKTCDDYLQTEFNPSIKKLLIGDFQNILTCINSFQ